MLLNAALLSESLCSFNPHLCYLTSPQFHLHALLDAMYWMTSWASILSTWLAVHTSASLLLGYISLSTLLFQSNKRRLLIVMLIVLSPTSWPNCYRKQRQRSIYMSGQRVYLAKVQGEWLIMTGREPRESKVWCDSGAGVKWPIRGRHKELDGERLASL